MQRVDERSREFLFQYSDSPRMISLSLPISSEPFTPAQTRPFFEALLPEGAVRERIAVQLKLATSDSYSLLSELGRDCACALQIFEARRLSQTPSVHWLSRDELDQLVEELMFARERGALVKRVLSVASLLRDEALQGRCRGAGTTPA